MIGFPPESVIDFTGMPNKQTKRFYISGLGVVCRGKDTRAPKRTRSREACGTGLTTARNQEIRYIT